MKEECGGSHRLKDDPIYFSSPGFPSKNYPNDVKCIWDFINDKNPNLLTFKLLELQTEPKADLIEVRNKDENGFILKSYSGNRMRGAVTTTTDSQMWVKFQSDFETNDKGFQAVVYPGITS